MTHEMEKYGYTKEYIREYNKTWYYKISRRCYWPKNLVSARPIRKFGVYLFTIYKLAKPNYKWDTSK